MGLHAVADDLQSLLVEAIDLALTSKQASWTLGWSSFSPVRAELDGLDGLAADARGCADELAYAWRTARLREWDPVSENLLDMTAVMVKHWRVLASRESDLSLPLNFATRQPRTARG